MTTPLLTDCASKPENFFYKYDAEDLRQVYSQIAYSFGCKDGRHDWGKPWQ